MNCEELAQLIPDMVDGTLSADVLAKAHAALLQCPVGQREFEIASQVRAFLIQLQAEQSDLHVPAGFEARLIARVQAQSNGVELLDLSSRIFGAWLVELINLTGGLLIPNVALEAGEVQPSDA